MTSKARKSASAGKTVTTDQTAKAESRPLTAKQEAFVAEYLIDFNGNQAAIRAGFSERSARKTAYELLDDPRISESIKKAINERSQRTEITADRVLREVARLGFSDVRKLFNQQGALKAVHELDDDTAAAVASIEVLEEYDGKGEERRLVGHVKKIKLWDKNSAAEKLMKHLGMFEKDNAQGAEALRSVLVEFVSAGQK
ncbi:MAG: terminase small subunit [Rhizobacter sp.]